MRKVKNYGQGGMMQGAEWEALEPVSNPYGRRPRETTCFCIPLLQAASFKNQDLVLTFWIGSQNVEQENRKRHFQQNIVKKENNLYIISQQYPKF